MNDLTEAGTSMFEEIARSTQNRLPPVGDLEAIRLALPKDEFSLVLLRGNVARGWLEAFAAMLVTAKMNALVIHADDSVDMEVLSRQEAADLIRGIAMQVPDAVLADAGLARIAR